MRVRDHLLIDHPAIDIEAEYNFIIVIRRITGIKPEALLPLLLLPVKEGQGGCHQPPARDEKKRVRGFQVMASNIVCMYKKGRRVGVELAQMVKSDMQGD